MGDRGERNTEADGDRMKTTGRLKAICALALAATSVGAAQERTVAQDREDRSREGAWTISDTTDNNTGEREVYALNIHLGDRNEFIVFRMRCSEGEPVLYLDWKDVRFPSQTVISIAPIVDPDAEPVEESYVFGESDRSYEDDLRASPRVSAQIMEAIGGAEYVIFTAFASPQTPIVGVDFAGAQAAWERVSRHCPIRTWPVPPE